MEKTAIYYHSQEDSDGIYILILSAEERCAQPHPSSTAANGSARNPWFVIKSVAVNLVDERSVRGETYNGLLCEPS
jgi:hypothetical protein